MPVPPLSHADDSETAPFRYPWKLEDPTLAGGPANLLRKEVARTAQRTKEAFRSWSVLDWAGFFIPAVVWLRTYKWKKWLVSDIIAGLSVGFMVVPQGMSYAALAGLPSVYGLYGAFLPCLVYCLVGSSKQLSVGPVAVTSLLLAGTLGPLIPCSADIANPNKLADQVEIDCQARYNQAAIQVCFLVACFYTAMGILHIGWVTKFLSHAVIGGFTTGAAIIIGIGQAKYILGYSIVMPGHSTRLQDYLQAYFSRIKYLRWQEYIMGITFIFILAQAQQIASLVDVVSLLVSRVPGAPMQMPHAEPARARAGHAAHSAAPRAAPAAEAAQPARPAAAAAPVASAGGGPATERPASGATRAASARGPSRRGGLPARVGDTSLRRSFVLSIPVARGANWFLAGGGRRMDEEEATAAAAERIAAAAEDGTSLPVRLATDVVRFLYGGTGRREPADGGVVSASLLNAKPAVGGIGVEPRGGGVLRVLFTVASDAVADTVVRWRHELRRCVDSTAVFDVLSDREEAQHQALWPAFLAAKVAGKRAQFHRARLVVDGERIAIKNGERLWKPLRHVRAMGAIFCCVVGILAVYIGKISDLAHGGIRIVGTIPQGLPPFTGHLWIPMENPSFSDLIAGCIVILVVALLESTSIARALARKNGYELSYNREIVGLGLANFAGAMSSTYTTTGSFSRSAVNNNAGAKTPLAQFICGWVVAFVLIFLTGPFARVPFNAMGAIVIVSVASLVEFEQAIFLWKVGERVRESERESERE
ncbi:hypothetical protein FOA52_009737 [Chlamydomonas sp. UWO 241]|nr:hypothetical protein FOA52_009737 [Chlamydomonas sp. UWO 241]